MKEYDRRKTRCFTGCRPEKLKIEEAVMEELKNAIAVSYQAWYRSFISGMASGVDIWVARLVLMMISEADKVVLWVRTITGVFARKEMNGCALPCRPCERSLEWQSYRTGNTVRYAKKPGIVVVPIDAGEALKNSGYIAENF